MGCGRISQRATQGSLYRGAGRQRRSERLKVGPYAQGRWPYIFLQSVTALFPSPDCDSVGDGQRASRREACVYPGFMTGDSLSVKTYPLYSNGLWLNLAAGCPLGQPLRTRPWAVYFFANCDLSSILVILSIAEYNKSETSKFPFFEVSESSNSKNRFF